eukprot:g72449.t1
MPLTIVTMILLEAAIHGDPPMLKVLPELEPTYKLHSKLFHFGLVFVANELGDDLGSYPLLISSPSTGVKKPPGYHLDLLICAGVILLCWASPGWSGLPFDPSHTNRV